MTLLVECIIALSVISRGFSQIYADFFVVGSYYFTQIAQITQITQITQIFIGGVYNNPRNLREKFHLRVIEYQGGCDVWRTSNHLIAGYMEQRDMCPVA